MDSFKDMDVKENREGTKRCCFQDDDKRRRLSVQLFKRWKAKRWLLLNFL